ncbi:unnamed protein product [Brassicogethes aeneus]|uniref:Uncharacterized protein n=1 Tax=Brassicogethes aeneus TaxID=1431903 RepID=A0A9P0AWY5_BRAAE|nr:unnamed protein product [Brassicogethes aeneus]
MGVKNHSIVTNRNQGHGILEFTTDKAGQDVTPMNLEFGEEKRRSSTLNSITGVLNQLKRSIPDLRLHKSTTQHQPLIDVSLPQGRIRTKLGTRRTSNQTHLNSGPLSSSTSLLHNSPSPPNNPDVPQEDTLVPLDTTGVGTSPVNAQVQTFVHSSTNDADKHDAESVLLGEYQLQAGSSSPSAFFSPRNDPRERREKYFDVAASAAEFQQRGFHV